MGPRSRLKLVEGFTTNKGTGMRSVYGPHNLILVTLVLLGLSGCGSPQSAPATPVSSHSSPASTVTTTPSGAEANLDGNASARELLNKSLEQMKSVKSYHYTTKTTSTGQPSGGGVEGDFESPDKIRMITQMGNNGVGELLIIGNEWYTKQPGSETYAKTDSPNVVGSVAPLGQLLDIGPTITNIMKIGDEQVEGAEVAHLSFDYDGSSGFPTEIVPLLEQTHGDVWIDKSTYYVRRQAFSSPSQTTVTTYSKLNEPVVPPIQRP